VGKVTDHVLLSAQYPGNAGALTTPNCIKTPLGNLNHEDFVVPKGVNVNAAV
jgi:hypothetical protein